MSGLAYIDASAFVKLFAQEPESEALASLVDTEWDNLVANEILAVEAFRAALRIGDSAPASASGFLRRVVLLPLSADVRERASRIGTPQLRALDAIHLATALSYDLRVEAIFTYDKRLAEASADAGLQVLAPV